MASQQNEDSVMNEAAPTRQKRKYVKRKRSKFAKDQIDLTFSARFNTREQEALAAGLQTYGFGEPKKISQLMKTKSADAVKHYVHNQYLRWRRKKHGLGYLRKSLRTWCDPKEDHLAKWPTIRKWRKIAYNQMNPCCRSHDYSKIIMPSLCQKFYEEEAEPSNPQLVNTKAMYKYIMDSMSGHLPADLPPLESHLMKQLMSQLEELQSSCDFSEEQSFIKEFKKAYSFRPFKIKDEFRKKKPIKDEDDNDNDNKSIPVVEKVFLDLSRHRKLMQSFNPLVVPVWLLEREQGQLKDVLSGISRESSEER